MKDTRSGNGQNMDSSLNKSVRQTSDISNFVLDKAIFSSVFEKDIRRVYLYKKAERLAKAIHLVGPAFTNSASLKDRLDRISIGLVDAAILPPSASREALSRELLALSSILSIARTGGMLSVMNADLIVREAHLLLQEIAGYEEPRLMLEEVPSLAALAKSVQAVPHASSQRLRSVAHVTYDSSLGGPETGNGHSKGQLSDIRVGEGEAKGNSNRRDAVLSVLRSRGASYIKDISTVIRDVSEKTIQRELSALVAEGMVLRKGDRRWTTYEIVTGV